MRAAALAALVACGGGSAVPAAPKQPAIDERKAEKDAKGLVGEITENVSHGNTDSLMSLLAEPLIVFGPRRTDALGNRADTLVALKELVDPKKKRLALASGDLSVVVAPGGHSAWAVDFVSIGGEPHVVTCVMSEADDLWTLAAAAVAHTPPMKEVRSLLKKDAIVPPGLSGVAKLDAAAKGAADKLSRGLADQKVWGDDLGSRSDAIVIGPGAGDVTHGKKDIKKLWDHRMKANTREAVVGDVTASTTPDQQLAWASAVVVRFEDDLDPLPLRVFAVFERDKDDWKMIALQESLSLDEPGVGANFRKVAAPPVATPPEEPKKTADTGKKTTKKKKKHKKSSDDE